MATIAQQNPDEEQQQNGPVNISGTGSPEGGTGGAGSAKAPTSPVAQNAAPQSVGQYNDVSGYLSANQGGANQIGQQAAQNLTNTYNTTKQGIDKSAQNTQQQVSSGYTPENTQLIQQVENNPVQAAASPDMLSQFQGQLNDKYTGPTSWADYGTQQGNVANAQQQGSLYNTQGGTNVLAQQVEQQNNGPYSAGINNLDALLLGSTPSAYSQIAAASQPYAGLGSYLDTQNTGINSAIQTGQTQATNAAHDALTGVGGQANALTGTLQSQLNSAQQKGIADNASLYQALTTPTANQSAADIGLGRQANRANGNEQWVPTNSVYLGGSGAVGATGQGGPTLTADQLSALGINPAQYQQLEQQVYEAQNPIEESAYKNQRAAFTTGTNVPLQDWLTQQDPTKALNLNNTATADQAAQANAYQQLLGTQNYTDPITGALTSAPQLNNFDLQGALKSIGDYNTQNQAATKQQADNVQQGADAQHNAGKGGFFKQVVNNPLTKYLENPLLTVPSQFQAVKNKI